MRVGLLPTHSLIVRPSLLQVPPTPKPSRLSPSRLAVGRGIPPSHAEQVYEAATATLLRADATPHELATVSRLKPDRSVRVKALTGLARVKTLQTQANRLSLRKVC